MATLDCAEKVYRNAGNRTLLDALPRGGRVLDCGCGAGDNARILQARGCAVVGVTISADERRMALPYCEEVFIANLERGLPPEVGRGYDLVLMSHVLEHLRSPERLLRDAAQALAPGGLLAVALPNIANLRSRLDLLRGRFEYTSVGVMDATHLRFYTFASGRRLLADSGYRVERSWAQGYFPLWRLRALLPGPLAERVNRWACARWPELFGVQCLYLARPAEAGR